MEERIDIGGGRIKRVKKEKEMKKMVMGEK